MNRPLDRGAAERENDLDAALRRRAREVIPGGMTGHMATRLLPDAYPQFYRRGEGARLWDANGREYLDFQCAYGPNLLGYRHEAVEAAAERQRRDGDVLSGPAPVMVSLAEALTARTAHADWAMFCKNGSDATTIALMVARAHTGRSRVLTARGAYHGSLPWCTPVPKGVAASERADIAHFDYNDLDSLEAQAEAAGDDLAAVLVSAFRHDAFVDQALPTADFARGVRDLCDRTGALLVLDEVRAGYRLHRDTSWSLLEVAPDLSAWGKVLANGHPLSAVLGADRLRAAAAGIYVTGSFWYAAVPMAAALATLEEVDRIDVPTRVEAVGTLLREGLHAQARRHGFSLRQTGPAQMPMVLFDDDPDLKKGFFFCSEAVRRGLLLHPWHNMFVSAAHTRRDVELALEITADAFAALAAAGELTEGLGAKLAASGRG